MRSSNLRVTKAEVATMFAEADADGNGEIDLTVFLELMASKSDATATNWWAGWKECTNFIIVTCHELELGRWWPTPCLSAPK
mgnify:CR=1 FL=1